MILRLLLVAAPLLGCGAQAFAQANAQLGLGSVSGAMLAPGAAAENLAPFLPGLSANVQGSGAPGLDGGSWAIYKKIARGFDPVPSLSVSRLAKGASAPATGPAGAYPYANGWFYTETSANDIGFEWGLVSWLNNAANASTRSQNVALAGIAVKQAWGQTFSTTGAQGTGSTATIAFAGSNVIPVGHTIWIQGLAPAGYNGKFKVTASAPGSVSFASPTTGAQTGAGTLADIEIGNSWGGNLNVTDQTGVSDPVASSVGLEVDNYSSAGTTDGNRQRVITQMMAAGGHVGYGLLMGTKSGATIDRAGLFGGDYQIGLDFTQGVFSAAPIFLAQGQKIVLDGAKSGAFSRALFVSGDVLYYRTPGGDHFAVDDKGNAHAASLSVGAGEVRAGAVVVNGKRGYTGTKTIGPCRLVIESGIITEVEGC